jgi:hypothetical protein
LFLLNFRVSKARLAPDGAGCVPAVVHRNMARTRATTSRLEGLGDIVVNAELSSDDTAVDRSCSVWRTKPALANATAAIRVHSPSPLIHIKAVIGRRYDLVPVRQRRAT